MILLCGGLRLCFTDAFVLFLGLASGNPSCLDLCKALGRSAKGVMCLATGRLSFLVGGIPFVLLLYGLGLNVLLHPVSIGGVKLFSR